MNPVSIVAIFMFFEKLLNFDAILTEGPIDDSSLDRNRWTGVAVMACNLL